MISGIFLSSLCAQQKLPYIDTVYDYRPAPGQFINKLPSYVTGDTKADMIRKVEECIVGEEQILISLGGYGGYVVFGFDHLVVNVPGEYDFKIWGNAFYADVNPNPNAPAEGGSCEPGIVMVSYDANQNKIPDDEWYELAGSEYNKTETIKNYVLSYYKPDPDKIPTPHPSYLYLNDTSYIQWISNQGDSGYIAKNRYHRQSYFPLWIEDDSLVFEGTKLADNYVDESGNGSLYILYAYPWGYADNHPNNNEKSNMNIEWAVDANGKKVNLPGIHFVKVYTGVNQYCGWLGETSTEIMGAEDLHIDAELHIDQEFPQDTKHIILIKNPVEHQLIISSSHNQMAEIYDYMGNKVLSFRLMNGMNHIDCNQLKNGIYILIAGNSRIKFYKQ